MRIVIEGPNNVGKSTFINNLMRDIPELQDYEIEHVCSNCPNDYAFHENLLCLNKDIIFDRFYVGETIYPRIYGRQAKLSTDEMTRLFQEYEDTIVIFIDADYAFIKQAYDNKNEEFNYKFVYDEKQAFMIKYRRLKEEDDSRVFRIKNHKDANYKYSNYSYEYVLEKIKKLIKNKEV